MIDSNIINKAIMIGGRESWALIRDNMDQGQRFYSVSYGTLVFVDFIVNEKGSRVPIFRNKAGLTSCDYFYRDLLCGDIFISKSDCEKESLKSKLRMLKTSFHSDDDFYLALSEFVAPRLKVELNRCDDSMHNQIIDVKDCFISDNGGILISVDELENG